MQVDFIMDIGGQLVYFLLRIGSLLLGHKKVKLNNLVIGASLGSIPMGRDASAQFDAWGLSAQRSPITSTLTDDDILEMV